MRTAKRSRRNTERKETDNPLTRTHLSKTALGRAQPSKAAHESAQADTAPQSCRGCHGGGIGQRVGSEGVAHERTEFRCT